MKTQSKILKSGLLVAGFLLAAFTTTLAQSSENITAWTTSKDVQKVANKKLFNDDNLQKSHIQVSSVSPTLNVSKDVHRKQEDEVAGRDNMVSKYPNWIISKGVHQRKK
jgi:hypothetical protein